MHHFGARRTTNNSGLFTSPTLDPVGDRPSFPQRETRTAAPPARAPAGRSPAPAGPGRSFTAVSRNEFDEFRAGDQRLMRVLSKADATGHEVLDLRALRPLAMRGVDSWNPDVVRTIHGYDAAPRPRQPLARSHMREWCVRFLPGVIGYLGRHFGVLVEYHHGNTSSSRPSCHPRSTQFAAALPSRSLASRLPVVPPSSVRRSRPPPRFRLPVRTG